MGTEASANTLDPEMQGITPRIIADIFKTAANSHPGVTISVSMLEIYDEKVWDLLSDHDRNEPLQIRENPRGGVYVSIFYFWTLNA